MAENPEDRRRTAPSSGDEVWLVRSVDDSIFDHIVQNTAALFDAPISAITLLGPDRQWFQNSVGLEIPSTSRAVSFCTHAVTHGDVMVVEDARADDRFKRNPLVTGDPYIRSYAGAPIYNSDGSAFGALCVIDRRKRKFRAEDLKVLRELRDVAERALAMQKEGRSLAAIEREIDGVLLGV